MSTESAMRLLIREGLQTPLLRECIDQNDMVQTVVNLHDQIAENGYAWAGLSSGEQVKVLALLDLWNGSGQVKLTSVWYDVDATTRRLILRCFEEKDARSE